MDTTNQLLDAQFKDATPEGTVQRILDLFHANGIEVEETWRESGVPYCYAMSVKVKGSTLRSNGKGLTKAFARASGYAELMERMQMGFTGNADAQKDGDFNPEQGKYPMLTPWELYSKNQRWYELLAQRYKNFTGRDIAPQYILLQHADKNSLVSATPYFNLVTCRTEHLPTMLRKRVYTTTGCAAGNTHEEAIVQAISEIVERNHQLCVLIEDLTLPDVPEDFLKQFHAAWEIICYLRTQGYKVLVKDCSLGTDFPVVCVCLIHIKTGRYHTHFGAYPKFEIALERSLTESFQGGTLQTVARTEGFLSSGKGGFFHLNMIDELGTGSGRKTAKFFTGKPDFVFRETVGFHGNSNRELFRECIEFFRKQGLDVLVRDRSTLGFPTCQVLVPGYSEPFVHRLDRKHDEHRFSDCAYRALRNPAGASEADLQGMLMHMGEMRKYKATIPGYQGFAAGTKLAVKLTGEENEFLTNASLGYAYYALGKLPEALQCAGAMAAVTAEADVPYLIALKRWLSMRMEGIGDPQIFNTLRHFHDAASLKQLEQDMTNGNPFARFTLRCDGICEESCRLFGRCQHRYASDLAQIIQQKDKELDTEAYNTYLANLLK